MLRRLLIPDPGTLCALAVGIPAAFSKLISFDLFFNIASGRSILANGFSEQDPFSLTAAGSWFPHEWGYGILANFSVGLLGGRGPAILTALVLAGGVLLLYKTIARAYGHGGLVPLVLLLLALAAQSYSWQAQRAYQLGNLLFMVALWMVFSYRTRPDRLIWLFVPLSLLWANLHGSWLAGPALLGSVAVGMAIDRQAPVRVYLTLAGMAGLGILAAAVSPGGFQTCLYPLGFLAGSKGQSIMEWHAMDFSLGPEKLVLVLMVIFLLAFLRPGRRRLALLIPAGGLSLAAILAERFVPVAAVFLAVASAELLSGTKFGKVNPLTAAIKRMDDILRATCLNAGGAVWTLVALAAVTTYFASTPLSLEKNMHPEYFPVDSLQALAERPPGRVLNRYRFGGAVSAIAGPEYKVFIDGRNDLFPDSIHAGYQKLVLLEPGWREVLADYRPDYILWSGINHGEGLLEELKRGEEFEPVAQDQAGVLFVRKPTPEGPAK